MSRLTILQMIPALEGGGVERGTLEVAKELVDRGHRSLVISSGGRLVAQLEAEGSEHFQWPVDRKSPITLRWIWPLRRFLQEQGVDILHYRSRVPGWVAYLAWRGMGEAFRPRLISTVHGLHSVSAYSEVMTKGERVIAVSETVREYILHNYPSVPVERIQLIYRGVDLSEFPYHYQPPNQWLHEWRSTYPQLVGRRIVALPGRLTRIKGHADFLTIVRSLRQESNDWMGLIVGGEDSKRRGYAKEIHQSVIDMGLEEAVIFLGHRSDIREIYSQCDAILSLSLKPESFGRTVLEALALGRPVVGYDYGGVGEVLAQLYPSGRVAAKDTDKVVYKLLQGLSPVGENQEFLKSQMLEQTLHLYESLTMAG